METWWIVKNYGIEAIPERHLMTDRFPARAVKTKIGPYWTRGDAARVLRLWKGFGG